MQFEPVIGGKKCRVIEFDRVLHVPALHSNLLSVLYLTSRKGWAVHIFSNKMSFRLHHHLYFTATVNEKNSAFLDGHVVCPDFAGFVSTCPVDIALWHRRFGHLNITDVKQMINKKMVEGMSI